ncbi:uncharacterized protein JCM10292_006182 [Rhodotorula paludigena]|uniref:uncharacterized protein n=1 Tax=Rhodotorula paludigena TaxID=86838 RepID=UPI00317A2BEA
MPPTLRQRAPHLVPALLFVVGFALLSWGGFFEPGGEFAESSVQSTHAADVGSLHVQGDGATLGAHDSSSPVDAGRRLRVGLAGAGSGKGRQSVQLSDGSKGDLAFTVQRGDSAHPLPPPLSRDAGNSAFAASQSRWTRLRTKVEGAVTSVGDLVLALFGFDEEDWFGLGDLDAGETGIEGGSLASWSESSVYVERTNSLHPSRPSAFGPHLLSEPLRGLLYPVESVLPTDAFGCTAAPVAPAPVTPSTRWIALVQRGKCAFSEKVRFAQGYGASAVVFGDRSEEEGGISGGHGLLTPWSPDETDDITISSTFVSRASYSSLLRTWQDEQDLAKQIPPMRDGTAQTDLVGRGDSSRAPELLGLEVVLSKDEVFAWPLLDLLFMMLFLPSLFTLVTVFIQRVRAARAQKAERAPKDAVARLPVFRWGEAEKPASPAAGTGATVARALEQDEEREVGIAHVPVSTAEPTEETALLDHSASTAPTPPSLAHRIVSRLPASIALRLPSRFVPPSGPAPTRNAPLPTRRYPSLTECPFCLCDFEPGDLVMELPCGHLFHSGEVESWLEGQKGVCPVCRMSVLAPPQADVDAAAAVADQQPQPPPLADGASVLVQPSAPQQQRGTLVHDSPRTALAASPVASSSSVPIEGLLERVPTAAVDRDARRDEA